MTDVYPNEQNKKWFEKHCSTYMLLIKAPPLKLLRKWTNQNILLSCVLSVLRKFLVCQESYSSSLMSAQYWKTCRNAFDCPLLHQLMVSACNTKLQILLLRYDWSTKSWIKPYNLIILEVIILWNHHHNQCHKHIHHFSTFPLILFLLILFYL
jgi:hypothetical protein